MTRLVRASEVGEYVFCQHAWWLHVVEGRHPTHTARLTRGTQRHRQHGQRVAASNILVIAAIVALLCGFIAALW
jgi:hypothetical protein